MIKHFTNHKIDHRSKASMMKFIDHHFSHSDGMYTPVTIANKIKLHGLPIPSDLRDAAWDYLAHESDGWGEWDIEFSFLIADFKHDNPGYEVFQAGRSGGWLELHKTGYSSIFSVYDPMISDENPIEDLRELCAIIERFDQFCEDVLTEFLFYVEQFKDEQAEIKAEEARESLALLEPAFPL